MKPAFSPYPCIVLFYLELDPFWTPYDCYQREAFSYTIVTSFCCVLESGNSTSRSFFVKLQTKRLGCSLHWFDFTLLKIKDRDQVGSEDLFCRQWVSNKLLLWRATRTCSYQNEKQQALHGEASPFQRKPLCTRALTLVHL